MLTGYLLWLVIIAAIGAAMNGGILFVFSTFVMSALRRLPPVQGLTAMQEINVTAVTPPFMTVFFGTAALCVAVGVGAVVDWNGWASALVLVAATLYLVGVIGVTAAFNVPRNNALATIDPAASDAAERWRRYNTNWTAGNHVRTVACVATATLLIIATRVG